MNWEELKDTINQNKLHLLQRSEQMETLYQQFKSALKTSSTSPLTVEEFILQKIKFAQSLMDEQKNYFVVLKNDFPYNIQPDIKHYVIWCPTHSSINNQNNTSINQQNILNVLDKNFGNSSHSYLVYNNPENLQSIKVVYHLHVFAKLDPELERNTNNGKDNLSRILLHLV